MKKILIVEDHEDVRKLVTLNLEKRGFTVFAAGNGREALNVAKQAIPDLVLMDLNMPEVDGWEAIGQLRADEDLRTIPIIALTAYTLPGDQARATNAGCKVCHAKPIDFDLLDRQIHSLIANEPLG